MTDIIKLLGAFEILREIKKDPTVYTEYGMSQINTYIREEVNQYLPNGFMPYINAKSGKIATRVDKLIKAKTGKGLTRTQKEKIGNIASRNISHNENVYYDFHDGVLDWVKGHFGNNNSCWRTSHASSAPMFEEGAGFGSGFAMRVFTPFPHNSDRPRNRDMTGSNKKMGIGLYYGGIYGYGRLWIMPWKDNSLIILNPYGERYEWFASTLTYIISANYDGEVHERRVPFKNTNTGLYANGDRCGIITLDEPFTGNVISVDIPRWVNKVCVYCEERYTRPIGDESPDVNGYCYDCGVQSALTKDIISKYRAIPISRDVKIRFRRKNVKVPAGSYIEGGFHDQIGFCTKCKTVHHRENQECEHDETS